VAITTIATVSVETQGMMPLSANLYKMANTNLEGVGDLCQNGGRQSLVKKLLLIFVWQTQKRRQGKNLKEHVKDTPLNTRIGKSIKALH